MNEHTALIYDLHRRVVIIMLRVGESTFKGSSWPQTSLN